MPTIEIAKPTKKQVIEKWRSHIPDIHNGAYRRKYDKAMNGKSLRAAVDSKCLDCVCWQSSEIAKCPVLTCPLYPYRRYGKSQQDANS